MRYIVENMSTDESNLKSTEQISASPDNAQNAGVEHEAVDDSTNDALGIKYIYNRDKLIRASIHPSIYLDANIFELLKEVSYRDGIDDPERLTISQIESFVEGAIYEKIDRSLLDYLKLGQNYSGKLQKKYKHLVTRKDVSDLERLVGPGRTALSRYSEQQKSVGNTQALGA
jgi:hypothetical protein